jgi:hypothetical protein
MTRIPLHPWTLDPDEAIQLQEALCEHLLLASCQGYRLPESIRAAH